MKILGINFGSSKPEPLPIQPTVQKDLTDTFHFVSQNSYAPSTSSYQYSGDMVKWGNNNLYPLDLDDFYKSSPIHSSIVKQKSNLVIGEGIDYTKFSGLTSEQQTSLLQFDAFVDAYGKTLFEVSEELALDYQVFGGMAIEVVWDMTFTRIIQVNRIPMMNVRLTKEQPNGTIQRFLYNKNWLRPSENGTVSIPAFDINNKEETNQLIFIKNPSLDGRYYPECPYQSGLNWIDVDASISRFHKSNIQNGFSPSLAFKFYTQPETPELKAKAVREIENSFSSPSNAGRAMVFFSDGKDTATDIETIQTANIDKVFTVVHDQVIDQITRAHRVPSGILFNVLNSTSKLSLAGEYEESFKIFEKTVISQDRKKLEGVLNKILKINGIDAGLRFKPYQVYNNQIN